MRKSIKTLECPRIRGRKPTRRFALDDERVKSEKERHRPQLAVQREIDLLLSLPGKSSRKKSCFLTCDPRGIVASYRASIYTLYWRIITFDRKAISNDLYEWRGPYRDELASCTIVLVARGERESVHVSFDIYNLFREARGASLLVNETRSQRTTRT